MQTTKKPAEELTKTGATSLSYDRPIIEAILDDTNPNIDPIDLVRVTGYIEVLAGESKEVQKIVKAYLENTEGN